MKAHIELGFCEFAETRVKVVKPLTIASLNFKEERMKLDLLGFSDSDSGENGHGSPDEDFVPVYNFGLPKGCSIFEQLSITADMEGLLEELRKPNLPYHCVVPSCQRRSYTSKAALRRHYVSHDPQMFSTLVCPLCKYTKAEDHPGEMTRHIVREHEKDEDWAKENVLVEVSEKLQSFRMSTGMTSRKGKPHGFTGPQRKGEGAFERKMGKKCSINIDDPDIKASFEEGGGHSETGSRWFCGVPDCNENFRLAYELKRHYVKHDKTLHKNSLECNSCPYSTHLQAMMQKHLEEEHPYLEFLEDALESQYKTVQTERWKEFNQKANALIELNPNSNGKEWENRQKIFPTIEVACPECNEIFNTQNSFEDHVKVHNPELVAFICEQCDEGFAVESVFNNHVKSHSTLYTSLRAGPVRCNGCSRHFHKVAEVKKHLMTHHMNLLENCHFCEQCTDFFTFKHSLRNHMFTHAAEVFRCPRCPAKFLTRKDSDEHIAKNTCKAKEMNHVCDDCGRRFQSPSMLEIHVRKVHLNILQYQCNICLMLFENMHLMERHIRNTHKMSEGPILEFFTFHTLEEAKLLDVDRLNANKPKGRRGERSTEKFACPFGCGGCFAQSGLTRHKKICSKSPDEFKTHMSTCDELDKSIADLMESRKDPVTGNLVWQCTQCEYFNKLKFTVKEHVETHIAGVEHKCPHCDKTSATRNALRGHVIRQHSNKIFGIEDKKELHNPIINNTPKLEQGVQIRSGDTAQNVNSLTNQIHDNGNVQDYSMKPPKKHVKARHEYLLPPQQARMKQEYPKQDYLMPQQPPPLPPQQVPQAPKQKSQRPSEQQLRPPSAHMGQFNQGLLNQLPFSHPLVTSPASPMVGRDYYADAASQNSEENLAYPEERVLQQQTPPQQNPQNPYGLPGYGLPIWPFYRQ